MPVALYCCTDKVSDYLENVGLKKFVLTWRESLWLLLVYFSNQPDYSKNITKFLNTKWKKKWKLFFCFLFFLALHTHYVLHNQSYPVGVDPLTVSSNPAIAIIISGAQEGLGLRVCQNASPGRKPLEEKPGGRRAMEKYQQKLEVLLSLTTGDMAITVKAMTSIQHWELFCPNANTRIL